MKRAALMLGAGIVLAGTALAWRQSRAESGAAPKEGLMVRIAVLEIDPAQLDAYKAILREEQEASVRLEPGVMMLHSVQFANDPTQIRLLEVYASRAAYEAHIRSPHFIKYKTSTERMVRSLELVPTDPILLCAKSRGRAGGPMTCL
ncbi:putative quinol monooxygenase [Sphingomonas sp. DT-204]|uniref:putative quinol monooxygenase n=1 Tax=Sphingomonas sp. DT-204 TaxID=3396166 RepID=UPI003F1D00F3